MKSAGYAAVVAGYAAAVARPHVRPVYVTPVHASCAQLHGSFQLTADIRDYTRQQIQF